MQEELRTARDFVLAARSAVRIADKRAAIAACDAACDASVCDLTPYLAAGSHRQRRVGAGASSSSRTEQPEQQQQAAPMMLLPAPAIGGESSGVAGEAAPRWERPDPRTRAKLIKSSSVSASDTEVHDRAAQLAFALSLARDAFLPFLADVALQLERARDDGAQRRRRHRAAHAHPAALERPALHRQPGAQREHRARRRRARRELGAVGRAAPSASSWRARIPSRRKK